MPSAIFSGGMDTIEAAMVYKMVWRLVYIGPPAPLAEGLSNAQIVGYSRVSGVIYKRWLGDLDSNQD
jgi:hypothetical protein